MTTRGTWGVRALSLALLLASSLGCRRAAPPKRFAATLPTLAAGSRFVVAGDLQRTPLLELRESNDRERQRLVQEMASLRPSFVALTGDLVDDGSSPREWSDFDELTAPLHEAGIPAFAALGNHEVEVSPDGARHLFDRFPSMAEKHFYVSGAGPIRMVVLDSNVLVLSPAEWQAERAWYEATLAALDADPSVRGVLVMLHHEPFTNSTLTDDEGHVQRDFVPRFLSAKKTMAMLSGHVHSYERFQRDGKTFVVSGGGGGPRVTLSTGAARRHPDDLFLGPALRDFHFVVYTLGEEGLSAEVRSLAKGGTAMTTMDTFSLSYPKP